MVPEFELFDLGHVATLHRLLGELGPPHGGHVHCDLVMGVPGGMPGNAATLVAAVGGAAGRSDLVGHRGRPDDAAGACSPRWRRAGTCGSGWRTRSASPAAGRCTGNAELVERAAALAGAGAAPADGAGQARALLGVNGRR